MYQNKNSTYRLCGKILESLEIEPGMNLLIHSSYSYLSRRGHLAEYFLEGILNFLTPTGTLIFPTLSWKEVSPENPIWYEDATKSNVGVLSEVFRLKFSTTRSTHPTHSVAIAGPHSEGLSHSHHLCETPCSPRSPWGLISTLDTRILLLGVDFDSCTLIHNAEETRFPDLFLKPDIEIYKCINKDKKEFSVKTRRHKKLNRNFFKYKQILQQEKLLRTLSFNNYTAYSFRAHDLTRLLNEEFGRDCEATIAKKGEPFKRM